jgi:hypothetical protein
MLYNPPRELSISIDNAPTNEAEKGLLRTSQVETGLIREGPWAAIVPLTGEVATPVAGCIGFYCTVDTTANPCRSSYVTCDTWVQSSRRHSVRSNERRCLAAAYRTLVLLHI